MSERTNGYRGALEAIERILNRGGNSDDVLRAVVARLHGHGLFPRVAISFAPGDETIATSGAGAAAGDTVSYPVSFEGRRVAALEIVGAVGDEEERAFVERVATLVSAHCSRGLSRAR
jgi:hypothetical protein